MLVTAGFLVAAIAYLLPFVELRSDYKYQGTESSGFELAVAGLFGPSATGPLDLHRYLFLISLVAAVGGVLYRRSGRVGSAARLLASAGGFGALTVGLSYALQTNWAYGFLAAEAGFLVATLASITSLGGAVWLARAGPQ